MRETELQRRAREAIERLAADINAGREPRDAAVLRAIYAALGT